MIWIFGYGSLIWRPGFDFVSRAPAVVSGYERRLEQGSPDHRGTPARLGRVATLVPREGALCGGVVYGITSESAPAILAALEHREQGGYDRLEIEATLSSDRATKVRAITFIATRENQYHLGEAALEVMISEIREAAGPSGSNVEYVLRLDEALSALGFEDPHIKALAEALRIE